MPIDRDLSDLPRVPPGAVMPDRDPAFLTELVTWWQASIEREDKTRVPTAPYWASDAGSRCLRQLQYAFDEVPRDPMPLSSEWRLNLGTMVHKFLEDAVVEHPRWLTEQRVDLRPAGLPGHGRADILITREDGSIEGVVDYKTASGFPFKLATTSFKGGPKGPSLGAMTQVACQVVALDAEYGIVVNLAMEVLGPDFATGRVSELDRFAAQWTMPRALCDALAWREARRVARVQAAREARLLITREISLPDVPEGAAITDPARKRWELRDANGNVQQFGSAWPCDYCSYRTRCITDGDGTHTEVDL